METRDSLLMTVRALMHVIDAADPTTRGRSLRMSHYVVRLARELGVPESDRFVIELGALLHDIGRNALLNDVAQQARPLDAGERAVVQTHPTIGWEILRPIPGLEEVAEIVLCHHERPDGRGYPRALQADQIPMGARLIMVCAAFEAMTEERPYRRGLPAALACQELQRHAGTQFFADVVEAFNRLHASGALWEDFTREEIELYVRRGDMAAA